MRHWGWMLVCVLLMACESTVADESPTAGDSTDDVANDATDAPDVGGDAADGSTAADAGPDLVASTGDFGQLCLPDAKCLGALVCYTFGDGIPRCTQACTAGDQCPAGSSGAVCTSKGYCKP